MTAATKISGSKQLKAQLKKLSQAAQGKLLERAVVAGALPVQNEAKRRAPVLTGNLRRSIHTGGHEEINPGGQGVRDSSGAGVPQPKIGKNRVDVWVGTDVIYASFLEFGTSRMAAQPFMRPAYDSQRDEAVKEMGLAMRDLIRAAI